MLTNITFKKLFLIDSIGAVFTALMLSQVLAQFEYAFGIPQPTLFTLASIAAGFALYSITCYWLVKKHWRRYLIAIAGANTAYCILTLGLMIKLSDTITHLGIAYFGGEIILVVALAILEFQFARTR